MEPAMLTKDFIENATSVIKNPRNSVEIIRSGQLYVPTIGRAVKDLGRKSVEGYIKMNLAMLNAVLNLSRPMTATMIEISAPLIVTHILEDDCSLNLADMKIIFERAMKGFYGSYYNGIGLQDIIKWIDAYVAEKCNEIERWHHNHNQSHNEANRYDRLSGSKDSERNAFHEAMVRYQHERINEQNNNEQ